MSNEAASPEAVPETVDALLSQTAPALTRQYDVADGLDQKALGILAVSGAVITIAGAGQAGSAAIATAVLIIAAAAVWVLVTAVALRQLWTRRFRAALTPDRWEDRRFYDPDAVKAQMLDEAAAAYRENRKINRRKEKALRIAIAGAAAQTLLVAAALVAGVLA